MGDGEVSGDEVTGGVVRGAGENSDSSRPSTPGFSGASGGTGGRTGGPPSATGGCGRLQAEKGGSGLETGGNSDSGGPEDGTPDGDVSHGAASPAGAGAAEAESAGWPRGAKGRRAESRNPHPSQNWPVVAVPQRGQVSPPLATNRPGAWCFPIIPS